MMPIGTEQWIELAGIMSVVLIAVGAGGAIFANEYFKRHGLPDDDGDE